MTFVVKETVTVIQMKCCCNAHELTVTLAGIGRATALALARGGAEVLAVTRTQADLDTLVQEVINLL